MTDTTTHASTAPTTPHSTPVEWHAVDADDRWPGRWTAHTASVHAHGRIYLIRITPGDHATYLASGFYADIDGGYGQHWAINTRTLDEASAAKDRHTLSETACDLIVIEHRLRDVRRWTPETARAARVLTSDDPDRIKRRAWTALAPA
jgi:hypothetical protein